MEGRLFSIIKRDAKRIINLGGYQISLTLSTKNGSKVIEIMGWGVKHHISFDSDGNQVNTKNARATIDEDVLVANAYPVRNAKGEVSMIGHLISFADSSKVIKTYRVRESFPDETLGLIVLTLGDYET